MPTPTKGARLGGSPAHERLMLANLATSLFQHGRITTTQAKAKKLRPYAERLITKAKVGDLHNRRMIMKVIRDKEVVHRLCTEIGPFFADRNGGYTRILKTIPRKGDNAPMAIIELVQEKTVTAEAEAARKTKFAKDEKPSRRPRRRPSDETAAEDAGGGRRGRGERVGRRAPLRRRQPRRAGGRLAAGGLPDQGQRRLDAVPRPGQRVLRPDRGRGVVRHRRGRGGSGLQPAASRRRTSPDRSSLGRARHPSGVAGSSASCWRSPTTAPSSPAGPANPAAARCARVLEDTLSMVLRDDVRLTVAGRTDAGVHATGQVAHADLPAAPDLNRLARALPAGRPGASRSARPRRASTPASRRSAGTTPTACATASGSADPLRRHDTVTWPRPLDVAALNEAAAPLLGLNDFVAFCRRREGATTIRDLQRLTWTRDGDGGHGRRVGGRVLPLDGPQPGRRAAGGRARAASRSSGRRRC